MKIWVDADACPKVIKDMLFRAADRAKIAVTLVANQWCYMPTSAFISFIQVEAGPDVADDEIVDKCEAGDLIITADIPTALDPRGRMYDKNNVKQILAMRDFMDSMRGSGIDTDGPNGFGQKERQLFANELDRFIARVARDG